MDVLLWFGRGSVLRLNRQRTQLRACGTPGSERPRLPVRLLVLTATTVDALHSLTGRATARKRQRPRAAHARHTSRCKAASAQSHPLLLRAVSPKPLTAAQCSLADKVCSGCATERACSKMFPRFPRFAIGFCGERGGAGAVSVRPAWGVHSDGRLPDVRPRGGDSGKSSQVACCTALQALGNAGSKK